MQRYIRADVIRGRRSSNGQNEEITTCRIDHYQTKDQVHVSVFAKRVDKKRSTVKFGEKEVSLWSSSQKATLTNLVERCLLTYIFRNPSDFVALSIFLVLLTPQLRPSKSWVPRSILTSRSCLLRSEILFLTRLNCVCKNGIPEAGQFWRKLPKI
jgi:hypothetical protein